MINVLKVVTTDGKDVYICCFSTILEKYYAYSNSILDREGKEYTFHHVSHRTNSFTRIAVDMGWDVFHDTFGKYTLFSIPMVRMQRKSNTFSILFTVMYVDVSTHFLKYIDVLLSKETCMVKLPKKDMLLEPHSTSMGCHSIIFSLW